MRLPLDFSTSLRIGSWLTLAILSLSASAARAQAIDPLEVATRAFTSPTFATADDEASTRPSTRPQNPSLLLARPSLGDDVRTTRAIRMHRAGWALTGLGLGGFVVGATVASAMDSRCAHAADACGARESPGLLVATLVAAPVIVSGIVVGGRGLGMQRRASRLELAANLRLTNGVYGFAVGGRY